MAACGTASRPRACNAPYDRAAKKLDLEALEPLLTKGKDTPIITHCGESPGACVASATELVAASCSRRGPHLTSLAPTHTNHRRRRPGAEGERLPRSAGLYERPQRRRAERKGKLGEIRENLMRCVGARVWQ